MLQRSIGWQHIDSAPGQGGSKQWSAWVYDWLYFLTQICSGVATPSSNNTPRFSVSRLQRGILPVAAWQQLQGTTPSWHRSKSGKATPVVVVRGLRLHDEEQQRDGQGRVPVISSTRGVAATACGLLPGVWLPSQNGSNVVGLQSAPWHGACFLPSFFPSNNWKGGVARQQLDEIQGRTLAVKGRG